jgi:siroheme synthase
VAELRAADLVISDKLTLEAMGGERMQALLSADCELTIARDKRSAKRGVNISDGVQDELNEQALQAARAGKRVVRLKSGDPFIYGRGGLSLQPLHSVTTQAVAVSERATVASDTGCFLLRTGEEVLYFRKHGRGMPCRVAGAASVTIVSE